MKRFTATEKWARDWFQDLSPRLKCFWFFLCDNADAAGVWEPNFRLASFQIGEPVAEADMKAFGDRIGKLGSGKFHIASFVEFQYGQISEACKAHIPVIRALKKHNLPIAYGKAMHSLKETEEETEEEIKKRKVKEGEEKISPPATDPALSELGGWEAKAKALYAHFGTVTGNKIAPSFQRDQAWREFMRRGFTADDLSRVVSFIRHQIARGAGGFSQQSLQFSTLLQDADRFEERLGLAKAAKTPAGACSAPLRPPPDGWKEWLRAKYPDSKISIWENVPEDVRREVTKALMQPL